MIPPGSPNKTDGKSQYQRRLARQRQLDLMEAAASGTVPSMQLDTSSMAETDGSYLRARSRSPEEIQVPGDRPYVPTRVSLAASQPRGSIFEHRQADVDDSGLNLMDHDTGIYVKPSQSSFFLNSIRRGMSSVGGLFTVGSGREGARKVNPFDRDRPDASPEEEDYLGENLHDVKSYTASKRTLRLSLLYPACQSFCTELRKRSLLLLAIAGVAVMLTALQMSWKKIGGGGGTTTPHYFPHHRISEKQLRKQNTERFNLILDHIVLNSVSHTNAFLDLMSSEYHALRWVAYSDPARLDPDDQGMLQRYSLAVFFYSSYLTFEPWAGQQKPVVDGDKQWEGVPNPGWRRKDFWLTEMGYCKWYGITCEPKSIDGADSPQDRYDGNGNIVSLNLTDNHVMGTLPPEFKGLDFLETLDLSHNKLSGSFPWQIGRMFQLHKIYLNHNQLTGTLPEEISFLEGTRQLRLGNNKFSGTIPSEINRLYNLEVLGLDNNKFTGSIPHMADLQKLKHLYADHNFLRGHLPYGLVRISDMFEIVLNDNQLSGTLHPEFETLRHLRRFNVENNKIGGTIPDGMFIELNHLEEIELANNELTGSLPKDLGTEARLRVVRFNNNKLSGSIPSTWDELISLEQLHLQENKITGPIPTVFGNMAALEELWLNNNQLSGMIPTQIGMATSLRTIFLEHNKLGGRVPTEIGLLEQLQTLRIFDNDLRGYIQDEICRLSNEFKLKSFAADCAKRGPIMKCDCCTKCY